MGLCIPIPHRALRARATKRSQMVAHSEGDADGERRARQRIEHHSPSFDEQAMWGRSLRSLHSIGDRQRFFGPTAKLHGVS